MDPIRWSRCCRLRRPRSSRCTAPTARRRHRSHRRAGRPTAPAARSVCMAASVIRPPGVRRSTGLATNDACPSLVPALAIDGVRIRRRRVGSGGIDQARAGDREAKRLAGRIVRLPAGGSGDELVAVCRAGRDLDRVVTRERAAATRRILRVSGRPTHEPPRSGGEHGAPFSPWEKGWG